MMNEETQSKLDFYLEVFEAVKQRVGDEQVAAVIVEQLGKDSRTTRLIGERNGNQVAGSGTDNGDAPTRKQLNYLKRLGVDIPEGITKRQASELIDEAVGEQ